MIKAFLFVYGTLRKLDSATVHPLLQDYCLFQSLGQLQGQMFITELGYPGVVLSKNSQHQVIGELYQITHLNRLLHQLDAYEECSACFPPPHEYLRQQVTILLPTTETVIAWCYIYNHDTKKLKLLPTGDYSTLLAK